MIAILQFDAASRMHLERMLAAGHLPGLASLRSRGTWLELNTPAVHFEGAASYSLSTGVNLGGHGLYYPWLWSATEQRVRFYDDVPAPEAVWERIGRAGRRSLVIDPYEIRAPERIHGLFLSGWQFKNRVVLRTRSVPRSIQRAFERELGRPPVGEEIYGRPDAASLLRLRNSLVAAPRRGSDVIETILKREPFDLVWISLSAAHIGGHRFYNIAQLSEELQLSRQHEKGNVVETPGLASALHEIYRAVDEALARIVAAFPEETDIIIMSPTGMGPNNSRSHLLPAMLDAVLTDRNPSAFQRKVAPGSSLWQIRAAVPTPVRSWIAQMIPDWLAVELAARLELRGVQWDRTKAFMLPNDDAGYLRLNLRGRERDGIVDPNEADYLLEKITKGLLTFQNGDGSQTVHKIWRISELGYPGPCRDQLPDLVVQWNERVITPLMGVRSKQFGEIPSPGWGTGRTGCHSGEAWALVIPGPSRLRTPIMSPHIIDITSTICTVLEVDPAGLQGRSLLEPRGYEAKETA
ncbi:MAG: alkaline phosphatase family protein [Deltaproteobacteria bacterium]|nr:alkaline phosphatase family protein [Deltaproteobacteria bacterium]